MGDERLPLHNRTLERLERISTRGLEADFLAFNTVQIAKYSNDFFGDITADNSALTAGGAGTAAALVSGGANGQVLLDTGPSDNQCSILYLPNTQFVADNNPVLDVYLKVDSVASGNAQIGFCNSEAAGILGGSGVGAVVSPLTDAPTFGSGVTDAVVVTYDLSSALSNPSYLRMAGIRASGTGWLVTPSDTAPTPALAADTFARITVAIQRTNLATDNTNAFFYLNGKLLGTKTTGAIGNTTAISPFVLIGATSATRRTMTVDYFEAYQLRSNSVIR